MRKENHAWSPISKQYSVVYLAMEIVYDYCFYRYNYKMWLSILLVNAVYYNILQNELTSMKKLILNWKVNTDNKRLLVYFYKILNFLNKSIHKRKILYLYQNFYCLLLTITSITLSDTSIKLVSLYIQISWYWHRFLLNLKKKLH